MRYRFETTRDWYGLENGHLRSKDVDGYFYKFCKAFDNLQQALWEFDGWKFDPNHLRVVDTETGVIYYPRW